MRFVLHLIKTLEEKRAINISFLKRENIREICIAAYIHLRREIELAPV